MSDMTEIEAEARAYVRVFSIRFNSGDETPEFRHLVSMLAIIDGLRAALARGYNIRENSDRRLHDALTAIDGLHADIAALREARTAAIKEAVIAWSVCASIHREYAKGRDALYTTRQSDFVKHENDCRDILNHTKC
jgi:hypothetical protein